MSTQYAAATFTQTIEVKNKIFAHFVCLLNSWLSPSTPISNTHFVSVIWDHPRRIKRECSIISPPLFFYKTQRFFFFARLQNFSITGHSWEDVVEAGSLGDRWVQMGTDGDRWGQMISITASCYTNRELIDLIS